MLERDGRGIHHALIVERGLLHRGSHVCGTGRAGDVPRQRRPLVVDAFHLVQRLEFAADERDAGMPCFNHHQREGL